MASLIKAAYSSNQMGMTLEQVDSKMQEEKVAQIQGIIEAMAAMVVIGSISTYKGVRKSEFKGFNIKNAG